jgi:hypothetical protein
MGKHFEGNPYKALGWVLDYPPLVMRARAGRASSEDQARYEEAREILRWQRELEREAVEASKQPMRICAVPPEMTEERVREIVREEKVGHEEEDDAAWMREEIGRAVEQHRKLYHKGQVLPRSSFEGHELNGKPAILVDRAAAEELGKALRNGGPVHPDWDSASVAQWYAHLRDYAHACGLPGFEEG